MSCIAGNGNIIAIANGLEIVCYDRLQNNTIKNDISFEADDEICDIALSSDCKSLAIITSNSKKLVIYNLPALKAVKVYDMPRRVSKIRFAVDNSRILVAGKTGDGSSYNISNDEDGANLLGHCSLLLNILHSADGKYIITSDRDEKIRVTCYPNTYSIHTYCLGHKEFVNNMELLPHDLKYLVSTSGDGTIRFWNYEKGSLCHTIETYVDVNDDNLELEFKKSMEKEDIDVECLPIVHFSIMKIDDSSSIIFTCVHLVKKIFVYLVKSDNDEFDHTLINTLEVFDFPHAIISQKFVLFVYFPNSEVFEYKITNNNNLQITVDFQNKIDIFKNIINSSSVPDNQNKIKDMYKRKFDNVQDYQNRKRKRLGLE